MTGTVHAGIGAALGGFMRDRKLAFIAGIFSHILADSVPHKDLSPEADFILLTGTMSLIVTRYGTGSPQFWGAVGAILPDLEHILHFAGIIEEWQKIFPTHLDSGRWHGRETTERVSQIVTIVACLLVADR